jgi:putative protease
MADKEIGRVVHYFDHVIAAVVKLTDSLAIGDRVRFVHHESTFDQTINSMEVEHVKVQSAKAGDEVAIKTAQKTHEHAIVYKLG